MKLEIIVHAQRMTILHATQGLYLSDDDEGFCGVEMRDSIAAALGGLNMYPKKSITHTKP